MFPYWFSRIAAPQKVHALQSDKYNVAFFFRKGRHQGPQITYLQFCGILVIFFMFLLFSMNSIGRICICVYISSNTRIYSISPEGFIQACVSVTLLQGAGSRKNGGSRKKNEIYIYLFIYFYFFAWPPLYIIFVAIPPLGWWAGTALLCK